MSRAIHPFAPLNCLLKYKVIVQVEIVPPFVFAMLYTGCASLIFVALGGLLRLLRACCILVPLLRGSLFRLERLQPLLVPLADYAQCRLALWLRHLGPVGYARDGAVDVDDERPDAGQLDGRAALGTDIEGYRF